MNLELRNKAVEKITAEALKINNNFAIFIEEHLTKICTSDNVANKLLDEKKSLEEFYKKCKNEARTKARSQGSGVQIAGLPDKEYYDMAEEYYGIDKVTNKTTSTVIDITDLL